MNPSSFYGFSNGPPIRHKVTRTTRQSNPWSALARAKQIKATKDTKDSATVEVIDLTVDEPCEVIDLTGDSDSDYSVNPAWAAPRFSFPFCKMTSDSLTGFPDENSAAVDSLLGLFKMRSTTLANRSLNPTPSKPVQNEATEQLPKHDALKAYITANFNQSDAVTPLTEILNNPVTPDLLTTLVNPTSWLSDEAINAFTAPFKLRYDYDSVRRWTKKQVRAGIFEFDRVVIPINKGNTHWCFAFISLRDQFHITFLDSLPGSTSDGSSCGVFVCYYAFCVARCEDVTSFTFSQTDAWLFRKAISYVLAYPLLTELNQLENESDNK
ncbi:cysteine proteinase [Rhizoclosmatium globosum]|uniref:Cysteine proteinase n=1 Tax=Rhizoclosmatium globosum TaxID=329046 RepID=A0A1Y2CSF1_9FUNG|nr:cysteine proteinase [Rhizoclosmatium globosum]|eukprot:ORY49931.1 cysteine proteinase [Rhizoclosmatium globosum]